MQRTTVEKDWKEDRESLFRIVLDYKRLRGYSYINYGGNKKGKIIPDKERNKVQLEGFNLACERTELSCEEKKMIEMEKKSYRGFTPRRIERMVMTKGLIRKDTLLLVVENSKGKFLAYPEGREPDDFPASDNSGALYVQLWKDYLFSAGEISKWIVNKIELGIINEEKILKKLEIY